MPQQERPEERSFSARRLARHSPRQRASRAFALSSLLALGLACTSSAPASTSSIQPSSTGAGQAGASGASGQGGAGGGAGGAGQGGASAAGSPPTAGSAPDVPPDCKPSKWEDIEPSPLPQEPNRQGPAMASNGDTLLVGGGLLISIDFENYYTDAATYDVVEGKWSKPIVGFGRFLDRWDSVTPFHEGFAYTFYNQVRTLLGTTSKQLGPDLPIPKSYPENLKNYLFWDGDKLLWFGESKSHFFAYRLPDSNEWEELATQGSPPPRTGLAIASSDKKKVLVWGGQAADGALSNQGYLYDSEADTWKPISTQNAPSPRTNSHAVWARDRFVVWGGYLPQEPYWSSAKPQYWPDGAEYFPDSDTWVTLPTENAPEGSPVKLFWTGKYVISWHPSRWQPAKLYLLDEKKWLDDPPCKESVGRTATWTKHGLVAWGFGSSHGSILKLP